MAPSTEQVRPKTVTIAIWVIWVLTALSVLSAIGQPVAGVPLLIIYLLILRGLYRRQAWSAYGGALLLTAAVVAALIPISQSFVAPMSWVLVGVNLAFQLAVALLLFLAGQALAAQQPDRVRWGWVAVSAAAVLFFAVFRTFVLPTGSMENTLLIGDYILARHAGIGTPSRGEVVACRMPFDHNQTSVKRVVAVGGDRVKILNKKLYINGELQREPYAVNKTEYTDAYRDNFPSAPNTRLYPGAEEMLQKNVVNGEVVVPAGRYFAMGDNRDSSLDSRYWGFLEQWDIIAKPVLVYYSVQRTTDQIAGGQQPLITPDQVRWSRLFQPVR